MSEPKIRLTQISPSATGTDSISGNVTITNDLTVGGNLTVSGDTTTLNVQTLLVEDNEIILNSNVTGSPSLNASVTVNRGSSSNAFLLWNEGTDKWGWSDDGNTVTEFATAVLKTGDTMTGQLNISSGGLLVTGNVGIGTLPSPYGSEFMGIDIGNSGGIFAYYGNQPAGDANMYITANLYYDGETYRLKNNAAGSYYDQSSGSHNWYSAQVGVAGATANASLVMRISGDGNVGIGTSVPLSKLHITGNTGGIYVNRTDGNPFVYFGVNGDFANIAAIYGSSSGLQFYTGTSTPERMRLDSSGNLFLNTFSGRGGGSTGFLFKLNPGKVYFEIMANNTTSSSDILFTDGTTGEYGIIGYDHDANCLRFYTNSNETMRITSGGNVGIGTTLPSYKTHIREGGITAAAISTGWPAYNAELAVQSKTVLFLDGGGNGAVSTAGQGASAVLLMGQYNDARGIITMAGAGGATPSDAGTGYGRDLMVKAGNSDNGNGLVGGRLFLAGGSGYSGGAFGSNYGAVVLQPQGGNVGIGTTSPSVKLDIVGGATRFGVFPQSTTNSGEAWVGRAADRFPGTLTIQLGGGSASSRNFEVVDYAWSVVLFSVTSGGNCNIYGALSKGSGSFKIDHPLPEKSNTHHLVHSFIEGPQADLIYSGRVQLENGLATVNIDAHSNMTEGTFVALCRDIRCFTTNETDWDAVRGSVSENILTIECQNPSSNAMVSWMVIGERKDKHMYDTEWTDENGKVIVEPEKETLNI